MKFLEKFYWYTISI